MFRIDALGECVERVAEAEIVGHDRAVPTAEKRRDRTPTATVVGDGLEQLVRRPAFRLESELRHECPDLIMVVVDRFAARFGMKSGRERIVESVNAPPD